MKSSVLHPRSDSRNWPRSSEWVDPMTNAEHGGDGVDGGIGKH